MKNTAFILLAIVWAIAPLADAATDNGSLAEQHFETAVERIRQLMYEDAIAELEKVIALAPESRIAHDAHYWIGQSYFRAGQFDAALSTLEKLIDEYPESAIIPVTQLMVGRVQLAKDNKRLRRTASDVSDRGVIIDPETGVKYTKTTTFTGKSDVIEYTTASTALNLSPNGKFLLWNKLVIPLDDGEPFDLVDMSARGSSLSPDGKKVVFHSGEGIWMIPVSPETGRSTGPAKKLLDGHYWSMPRPRWAPDSERIVFERREKEGRGDLWVLSAKDGSLTQITDDPVYEGWPVWSPDGKTIAYKRLYETWVIPAKGGSPRKISSGNARVSSWSPDSTWLILRFFARDWRLGFFRLADEREFGITPPGEVGTHFAWAPDGKKMLFYSSSYHYKAALKVVSASGGPSFELGGQLKLWPYNQYWSPDSRMIVAGGRTKDGGLALWIIPLAGGEPFLLELDVSVPGNPVPLSLSPDRRKLLFSIKRSENTEDLWVVPVSLKDGRTTGPAVMISSGRDTDNSLSGGLSWAPDGTKLAIADKDHLWIASAEGGQPVQLTETPERKFRPDWLPGGEMISYIAYHSQKEQPLMLISASGGEPRKVLALDKPVEYTWSPDGRELAFSSEGLILAIPIAGGEARRIVDLKALAIDSILDLSWSPDGRHLAFSSYNYATGKPGPGPIFVVSAEGGEITRLATDDSGEKDELYWSPDGKWISYDSDGMVKTGPEGAIWEADVSELLSAGESEQ